PHTNPTRTAPAAPANAPSHPPKQHPRKRRTPDPSRPTNHRKADAGHNRIYLNKLTNTELHQLKTALQTVEHTNPKPRPKRKPEPPPDAASNTSRSVRALRPQTPPAD